MKSLEIVVEANEKTKTESHKIILGESSQETILRVVTCRIKTTLRRHNLTTNKMYIIDMLKNTGLLCLHFLVFE